MFNKTSQIISLKDDQWLHRQQYAGEVVSSAHREIFNLFKTKSIKNLIEVESYVHDHIIKNGCENAFWKYKNFPGKICASVNNVIVHGIPSLKPLQEGDVVKIDLGANFEGAIADCAFTYVFGKPKSKLIAQLLTSCQNALNKSIEAIEVGKNIGIIGHTIFNIAKDNNFSVIVNYGGHGIDYNKLHSNPFISNKSRENEGIIIQPGLSIAIEPMFVLGNNTNTKTDPHDKWSVYTKDIGVHFEHSVTLDKNGNKHIITNHKLNVEDML